jgi:DNA replication and repair protein RecF
LEEGSLRRRRLFDWGVFHVKHDYLDIYRRYQRALRQRNAALRTGMADSFHVWDSELCATAPSIDGLRADYARLLKGEFEAVCRRLFELPATLEYRRGWGLDMNYEAALKESGARDLRVRSTSVGPHRADVTIKIQGLGVRDRVSRGQQKLLACAFIIAQLRVRARSAEVRACLLLDDPAAELDVDNLGKLLSLLAELPAQLIVTSLRAEGLAELKIRRLFHVEQGKFSEVI